MTGEPLTVSSDDILAMIGYRAQQIVSAVGARAAGAQAPTPEALRSTLEHMIELAGRLETRSESAN